MQEFYDADTVELISWIKWVTGSFCIFADIFVVYIVAPYVFFRSSSSQAPGAAVFAGSPELLGTVKLCSGSAVTSLPLYSDVHLLRRSEDVSETKCVF